MFVVPRHREIDGADPYLPIANHLADIFKAITPRGDWLTEEKLDWEESTMAGRGLLESTMNSVPMEDIGEPPQQRLSRPRSPEPALDPSKPLPGDRLRKKARRFKGRKKY